MGWKSMSCCIGTGKRCSLEGALQMLPSSMLTIPPEASILSGLKLYPGIPLLADTVTELHWCRPPQGREPTGTCLFARDSIVFPPLKTRQGSRSDIFIMYGCCSAVLEGWNQSDDHHRVHCCPPHRVNLTELLMERYRLDNHRQQP